MNCLIVSPIPSHPQHQGNSARIFRLGRNLQALGLRVHFLYFPLEGVSPAQGRLMGETWDGFYTIPADGYRQQMSQRDHWGLDDWYDHRLDEVIGELHRRWRFQVALVHYVWFSAALEVLPDTTLKLIDTHDVFGDRHLRARDAGMEPAWYYTSVAEERRGLARAHAVIAIQEEERRWFRSLGLPRVATVGYIAPARRVPAPGGTRPVVGYLASGNPWNRRAFAGLLEVLADRPQLVAAADFVVAGAICEGLGPDTGPFRVLGRLDSVDDFYRGVDIAVNPMGGGTGLKIKTVEALSYGRPLVSTRDGFAGIRSAEPAHACADAAGMCAALAGLVGDAAARERAAAVSRRVFEDCQREQMDNLTALLAAHGRLPRRAA